MAKEGLPVLKDMQFQGKLNTSDGKSNAGASLDPFGTDPDQ